VETSLADWLEHPLLPAAPEIRDASRKALETIRSMAAKVNERLGELDKAKDEWQVLALQRGYIIAKLELELAQTASTYEMCV
jgi:hypothetical protein